VRQTGRQIPVLRTFKIYQNKESSVCRHATYIKLITWIWIQKCHYGANKRTCMNCLENLSHLSTSKHLYWQTAFLSKTHSLNNYITLNYNMHGLKLNSRTPQSLALIYAPAVNYPVQYEQSHLHRVCISTLYQSTPKNRTILITN